MSKVNVALVDVGDKVLTEWDDSDKPIWATVRDSWRGHRCKAFLVDMPDGTIEEIRADQIVAATPG